MMKRKLFNSLLLLFVAGVGFSACAYPGNGGGEKSGVNETGSKVPGGGSSGSGAPAVGGAPAADQKKGDTVKMGVISAVGGSFFIQAVGQQPEAIESYAYDLASYVGQTVTITGQYSGDTLFVGKIE